MKTLTLLLLLVSFNAGAAEINYCAVNAQFEKNCFGYSVHQGSSLFKSSAEHYKECCESAETYKEFSKTK